MVSSSIENSAAVDFLLTTTTTSSVLLSCHLGRLLICKQIWPGCISGLSLLGRVLTTLPTIFGLDGCCFSGVSLKLSLQHVSGFGAHQSGGQNQHRQQGGPNHYTQQGPGGSPGYVQQQNRYPTGHQQGQVAPAQKQAGRGRGVVVVSNQQNNSGERVPGMPPPGMPSQGPGQWQPQVGCEKRASRTWSKLDFVTMSICQ